MKILRSILAVVVGYAIFVVSALVLFRLLGIDPHAEPTIIVMMAVIAWGAFFSWLGGFVAQVIQVAAIFLFAPMSVVGGLLRIRMRKSA